ncbi:hypothetical protein DPV78_010614 [Talaromyces pinophilus]|nr:hypothetical protein DPV78_010614 [Talaromyces pinophilus]
MAEIKDDAKLVNQHTAAATPSAPSTAVTSSAEKCVDVNGIPPLPDFIYTSILMCHSNEKYLIHQNKPTTLINPFSAQQSTTTQTLT